LLEPNPEVEPNPELDPNPPLELESLPEPVPPVVPSIDQVDCGLGAGTMGIVSPVFGGPGKAKRQALRYPRRRLPAVPSDQTSESFDF